MNESRVDVVQLQKRDPQAWTAVLAAHEELEDTAVTAVTAMPYNSENGEKNGSHRITRYLVSLANTSDPIPFIGKSTCRKEALFYRDLAAEIPFIAPRCWFSHVMDDGGWVILEDVPSHTREDAWMPEDVDAVIHKMARLHFAFWDQSDLPLHYPWLRSYLGRDQETYTWRQLRQEYAVLFEEGPAALISDHAIHHLGHLAPRFLEAANGLAVIQSLGGWPGVIGESHMAAVADLLDDPLPMLEPLQRLPHTLMHGDMNKRHWHLTLFEEQRLFDWHKVSLGPAIIDLISFQEQFDLLFSQEGKQLTLTSGQPSVTTETIIDSYLLTMKTELGPRFDARQMRLALPAARCLQIITTCFPYFATWYDRLPDKHTWQRANRSGDAEFSGPAPRALMAIKPAMRETFRRFLQASRML